MDTPAPLTVPKLAVNAANEGIPVAAIARLLATDLSDVYELLKDAKARGSIAEMPRPDWPPGTRLTDRLPAIAMPNDDDLAFMCTKTFKLTGLEAGFLVVLLKHQQVEKTRLHNIVEQKRMTRQSQPSNQEATDPKMVDVMICKLRKKLKAADDKLKIETIWGGGYYIENTVKPLILAHVHGVPHATQETPSGSDREAPSDKLVQSSAG